MHIVDCEIANGVLINGRYEVMVLEVANGKVRLGYRDCQDPGSCSESVLKVSENPPDSDNDDEEPPVLPFPFLNR